MTIDSALYPTHIIPPLPHDCYRSDPSLLACLVSEKIELIKQLRPHGAVSCVPLAEQASVGMYRFVPGV